MKCLHQNPSLLFKTAKSRVFYFGLENSEEQEGELTFVNSYIVVVEVIIIISF